MEDKILGAILGQYLASTVYDSDALLPHIMNTLSGVSARADSTPDGALNETHTSCVLKVAPIALYMPLGEHINEIQRVVALTHGNAGCIMSACVVGDLIVLLASGLDLAKIAAHLENITAPASANDAPTRANSAPAGADGTRTANGQHAAAGAIALGRRGQLDAICAVWPPDHVLCAVGVAAYTLTALATAESTHSVVDFEKLTARLAALDPTHAALGGAIWGAHYGANMLLDRVSVDKKTIMLFKSYFNA